MFFSSCFSNHCLWSVAAIECHQTDCVFVVISVPFFFFFLIVAVSANHVSSARVLHSLVIHVKLLKTVRVLAIGAVDDWPRDPIGISHVRRLPSRKSRDHLSFGVASTIETACMKGNMEIHFLF